MQQAEGAQDLESTAVPMTGSERQLKTQGWLWGHDTNMAENAEHPSLQHSPTLPLIFPSFQSTWSSLTPFSWLCFNSLLPLG